MHTQLIIDAFEKANDNLIQQGTSNPSKRQKSIELSDYLTDDHGFSFGDKSFRNYYDAAMTSKEVVISQKAVILGLCQYLGYDTYEAYRNSKPLGSHDPKNTLKNPKKSRRNIIVLVSIGFAILLGIFLIVVPPKQRWMVWDGDHYEEAPFSQEAMTNGKLKLYKKDRIEHFRKVETPDCQYKFFNENGDVNSWYGKNHKGDVEVFTDYGLHPETGKTLKPITTYMIRKYFCDSY